MIGLALLAMASAHACEVEHARYILRGSPKITAHFERAPVNDDWREGLVVAIHGSETGRTSYWLPWYGGTNDQRHIRRTMLFERSPDVEGQRRTNSAADLDFFVLNRTYDFFPNFPKRGGAAPAHLLIPNLDLWHDTAANGPRDSSPRAFFDRVGCDRRVSGDKGRDVILPHIN